MAIVFYMVRRSKFNVGKDKSDRTYDGIVFDSAVEMRYYKEVIVPQSACGEITYYERQKKYELQPSYIYQGKKIRPIDYKADFYIEYKNGNKVVVDIKGCPDSVAKLKRKMFSYKYPQIDYQWIGYSKVSGGWKTYEEIQAGRKLRKLAKEQNKEIQGK